MVVYKFKIQNKIDISNYLDQYNNVLRFAYNRFQKNTGIRQPEVEKAVKDTMKNVELLDASLIKMAVSEAKNLKKERIVFGGLSNFKRRKYNKITKEEWLKRRNVPMFLRGSSCDTNGNRKAKLEIIENNQVILKMNKKTHITIQLPKLSKKQKEYLGKLQTLCENNEACFSLKIDEEFIRISFDEKYLRSPEERNIIENRILSFDLNPNYIGLSVIDWRSDDDKTVVYREIIDLRILNTKEQKKSLNNKRRHETFCASKHICNLAKHYSVEAVCFEKLDIKSKDNKNGKRFNRLVNNQWLRTQFIQNVMKRCNIENIRFQEVYPHYSSFVGQMTNPNDIDSVAASVEISRRGFNFLNKYIKKNENTTCVMYPVFIPSNLPTRWKEMVVCDQGIDGWVKLYKKVKKSGSSYRFLFDDALSNIISFRMFSVKSKVLLHTFT